MSRPARHRDGSLSVGAVAHAWLMSGGIGMGTRRIATVIILAFLGAACTGAPAAPQSTIAPEAPIAAAAAPSPSPATIHVVGGGQTAAPKPTGASATPRPTPKATPTPKPTPKPTPRPTPRPTPKPTAPPSGVYGNPWGYNFTPGNYIYNPPGTFCSYFPCIASFWTSTNGYVEQCVDLTFSHSGGRSGSCSHHGGNYRPLYSH
jgi:hypothetical protein